MVGVARWGTHRLRWDLDGGKAFLGDIVIYLFTRLLIVDNGCTLGRGYCTAGRGRRGRGRWVQT